MSYGDFDIRAEREIWLSIDGKVSWKSKSLQILIPISFGTALFRSLGVFHTNSFENFRWSFIPFVLLFSISNSLSEELIFRFAIIGGLFGEIPKIWIPILSALSFGIPHYFGLPNGFIGVFMASFLGYILCKISYETKGIGIAWLFHFIQDIIISSALFMMSVKS